MLDGISLILIGIMVFLSSFLQAATGFGGGLLSMSLLPLILPMPTSAAISAAMIVVIGIQMIWKLRSHLEISKIMIPVVCCLATINLGLIFLNTFDEMLLRIILAGVFIALTGLFFVMQRRQIHLPKSWYSGALVGLMAGVSTGMFNISGPFFLIYYLDICTSTLNLKASLEFTFLIAGMYSLFMHSFVYHNVNVQMLPAIAVTVAAALIAGVVGLRLYQKIDKEKISLIVYIILPIMAVTLIVNGMA